MARPAFSLESLKPDRRETGVPSGSLLEVTVWNLHEPGQPHTFPVRVAPDGSIDLPLAGRVSVAGLTVAECEGAVAHEYKSAEILVDPRVIVRSLESPTLKVQVTGAIARAGYVELPREEPTVYAALVAAGGLKPNAGTHIRVEQPGARGPAAGAAQPGGDAAGVLAKFDALPATGQGFARRPEGRANSNEEVSVPESPESVGPFQNSGGAWRTGAAGLPATGDPADASPLAGWFDVSNAADVERLKRLRLEAGAVVVVREVAPAVRVGGQVVRAGAYHLPTDRELNVWKVIELAGGVRDVDGPAEVVLLRMDDEGRRMRLWSVELPHFSQHAETSPPVHPGDIIHVEAPSNSRIRKAVKGIGRRS